MSGRQIALLGPPAAGKSTLARALSDSLDVPCIGIGDRLRAAAKEDPEIAATLTAGAFVPDEIAWDLIADDIHGARAGAGGFILDGFPRTIGQVGLLDHVGGRQPCPNIVICLDLDADVAGARIQARAGAPTSRRADDLSGEAISTRQQLHRDAGSAVLDTYARRGILHSLDATASAEELHSAVLRLALSDA